MTYRVGPKQVVVTMVQQVMIPPSLNLEMSQASQESGTIDDFVEHGRKIFDALPSPVKLKWIVGGDPRDRFPEADIYVVDGVTFYLPEDMIELIGERVLNFDRGMLRFEPELELSEIELPPRKGVP